MNSFNWMDAGCWMLDANSLNSNFPVCQISWKSFSINFSKFSFHPLFKVLEPKEPPTESIVNLFLSKPNFSFAKSLSIKSVMIFLRIGFPRKKVFVPWKNFSIFG